MASSRLPIEKFLPAYLKAVEEGVSKEEFAKKMGLKASTVYQRVYELRREGHDIPLLKCEGRVSRHDKAAQILAEYRKEKPVAKKKSEPTPAKKEKVVKVESPVLDTEDTSDELADIFGDSN